ncbi:MAG: glycosyltransferase [Planctomycetes bacterium]|nr:glycosyltransferase [Planctomycetota bacterium]
MGRLLDQYGEEMLPGRTERLERLAAPLAGLRLLHVNSTKVGGGVAEMLQRLMPLFEDLGLRPRWEIVEGTPAFFDVTKSFHNALQGKNLVLTAAMRETYLAVARANAARLDLSADAVVIHDPQPAPFVEKREGPAPWIWRCHIDLSRPDREFWEFLRSFVVRYDAAIFSLPQFARRMAIPQFLVWPSIDPLSDKNLPMAPEEVEATLRRLGVPADRPIVLQVSRFDRFKDPVGVVKAFRLVRRRTDAVLVLAGGGADDDPEGAAVLAEVRSAAEGDPDIHVLLLPPTAHREINALQRAATVVVQKSTREGFGLTVTEAMWKGKPVVGGLTGGIATQIVHGLNGFLVSSVEGAAFRIQTLLENPDLARQMGEEGREHVRRNFLITRSVRDYLVLLTWLKERRR